MITTAPFLYACPACSNPLKEATSEALCCPADGTIYRQIDGIWRLFPSEIQSDYHRFIQEYEQIREIEGRGSADPSFYRALPFEDLSGRFRADWQIRKRSYQTLLHKVVQPLESRSQHPLNVADLGAGNGWLSYRLAQRGHQAAAVDILVNPRDGLGAWEQYDAEFIPIQADFDHLPFQEDQFDLVVYNASLHYSRKYEITLCAAWRLLRPGGVLAILDSPIYHRASSGDQMVREREAHFRQMVGFPSNSLDSENYLTYERLEELETAIGTKWQFARPFFGLDWALRPLRARLLGRREPAQFALVSARKPAGAG